MIASFRFQKPSSWIRASRLARLIAWLPSFSPFPPPEIMSNRLVAHRSEVLLV